MDYSRRGFLRLAVSTLTALTTSSCARIEDEEPSTSEVPATEEVVEEPQVDTRAFAKLALDSREWKYDEESDIYYQLGVPYCLEPESLALESLAIFVPGPYLRAADEESEEEDGFVVARDARVGAYTAATAPILMPINSGTFGAQSSPTAYSPQGLERYMSAGVIYVYAGFRGRSPGYESQSGHRAKAFSGGVPWPVVDLKAAIRFLRYNADAIPGDTDRILTFGFSGGGGISCAVGASGDAEPFDAYLDHIGAITHDAEGQPVSDAVFGSASWCPITSLGSADASYEWMMGQYETVATRAPETWTSLLSHDLAAAYARHVNEMGLVDAEGNPLTLTETEEGIYTAGTYYDHLISLVDQSASAFFAETTFPYSHAPEHLVSASFPGDPNLQRTGAGTSDIEQVTGDASAVEASVPVQPTVFATDLDYVNHLNADVWWLTYNQRRKSAYVSSLGELTRHHKTAAKDVCAFDAIGRSSVENQLFGVDDASSLHFSSMVCDCLLEGRESYAAAEGFDDVYVTDWTGDLTELDSLEVDMATRREMFDPLHFLLESSSGFGTSSVCPHWRINTGIFQTDTSLCTEANLALALSQAEAVADISFTPVWGQGHVLAERSGDAEDNLLEWVESLCVEKTEEEAEPAQEDAGDVGTV